MPAGDPADIVTPTAAPTWLALAPRDLIAALVPRVAPSARLRAVSDVGGFRDALIADRPRVALLCRPPAGETELSLATAEARRRPSMRTVLLNERSDVDTRLSALRQGFDACMELDVDLDELVGPLENLSERHVPQPRQHRLAIDDELELDLDARVLVRDGRPIHLSPMEFRLLEFMGRHPGRTYSRNDLLSRVWGVRDGVDPRTVDVHIRWLRAKLEGDPDRPRRLTTVRGVGYRLAPGQR